jgi:hypothetical protein
MTRFWRVKKEQVLNLRLRLITIAIAISASCIGSCSKRTEHNVFDLPCGQGRLVLHEDHLATFETTYVTFELRYIEGKNVRLVDKLKPRARLYLAPTTAQKLRHFRGNSAEDPWPIFVSPNQFTFAEYEQIRQTLESSLALIDEAVNRPREPLEHFREDRRPMISSIRYIDYDGLRYTYAGPDKHTDLTVEPDGSVWLGQAWGAGGTSKILIGFANERRLVLAPYGSKLTQTSSGKNIYTQANVQQWKAKGGHNIFDDFEVKVSSSEAEFDAAMAQRRRNTSDR